MSRKLIKSTAIVGVNTFLSRVLGFVRDMIVARVFGTSAGTDAFFVAFRIPNFMRRLFAEGAFAQAFIPVLTEYHGQRTEQETRMLVQCVMGTLGGVLTLITIIGMLVAPLIVIAFAPGFIGVDDKFALTADLLRITFPYLLFISLTALAGAVLNSYGRFALPAFTPVLLNLSMIGATLFVAPLLARPIEALAWGVFVAGIVQLLVQIPALRRVRMLTWPRWNWHDAGVRRIMSLMVPAIFGSSVAQINLLFDTLVASFLVTGSVSWLYYSDRLVEFPLGIFGIALATVILPSLSKTHAAQSPRDFTNTLDWGLRVTMLVGAPATVGLVVLAGPIVQTLFQHGEFDAQDARMTTLSLMTYSVGLMGFILVKVLAPGFYARQDTKTPVTIGIIAMLANMILTVTIVVPMVTLRIPGAHAGLALATALAAYVNAGLLFVHLRRAGIYQPAPGWFTLWTQLIFASTVMGALLGFVVPDAEVWMHWSLAERAARLSFWIAAAVSIYFVCLVATGTRLKDLLRLRKG